MVVVGYKVPQETRSGAGGERGGQSLEDIR
jgi:hypothetical protein